MLKCERWVLKGLEWLNGTCSIVQWSELTPLAQTSGHGLIATSVLKQQQIRSIGLKEIAVADNN